MDDRRSDLNAFYWLFYIERQREFWVKSRFFTARSCTSLFNRQFSVVARLAVACARQKLIAPIVHRMKREGSRTRIHYPQGESLTDPSLKLPMAAGVAMTQRSVLSCDRVFVESLALAQC